MPRGEIPRRKDVQIIVTVVVYNAGATPVMAKRSGSTRIGGQGAEDTTTEIKEHSLRTMKLCQSLFAKR